MCLILINDSITRLKNNNLFGTGNIFDKIQQASTTEKILIRVMETGLSKCSLSNKNSSQGYPCGRKSWAATLFLPAKPSKYCRILRYLIASTFKRNGVKMFSITKRATKQKKTLISLLLNPGEVILSLLLVTVIKIR